MGAGPFFLEGLQEHRVDIYNVHERRVLRGEALMRSRKKVGSSSARGKRAVGEKTKPRDAIYQLTMITIN